MRGPRDFDSELRALTDKAKLLRTRKLHQLGELVVATGADALPIEQLTGLLLAGVETTDASVKESWRKRGAALFQREGRTRRTTSGDTGGAAVGDRSASPAGS